MPASELGNNKEETVCCDWLLNELMKNEKKIDENLSNLLILDCRNLFDFKECHVKNSVALTLPSIMLRRLANGKVDLLTTIKCQDLRNHVEYLLDKSGKFILIGNFNDNLINNQDYQHQIETINVLARRLKNLGGQVAILEGGFNKFRDNYPEWCEFNQNSSDGGGGQSDTETNDGDLMGLRSLRISTPTSSSTTDNNSTTRNNLRKNDCDSGLAIHNYSSIDDDKDFPVEILPHLYLGNAANSEDSESLSRHNIYYILNVTPDLPNVFENEGSIKYMQIPISDHWSQNLASFFPQAIQFIEEARNSDKGILVHCLAGISRSVTVTVAYLMHKCNLSLNDAFTLVRDRKANIAPNFHFMEQLHSFENELRAKGHRIRSIEQRCQGACSRLSNGLCNCPLPSYADLGLSPDSGIEFDRWAAAGTPAE